MDRDEMMREARSRTGAPPESVVIATEERAGNLYTFYRDSAGMLWYTSARTEAFDAWIKAAARQRRDEKRKASGASREVAPEEPAILTDQHRFSIA